MASLFLSLTLCVGALSFIRPTVDPRAQIPRYYMATFVDINLGQFFTVQEFLNIYSSLSSPIHGVYAIESKSGDIQLVDASFNILEDIKSLVNSKDASTIHGVRVQSFQQSNLDAMTAYKNELVRQTQPILTSMGSNQAAAVSQTFQQTPDGELKEDTTACGEVNESTQMTADNIVSPFDHSSAASTVAASDRLPNMGTGTTIAATSSKPYQELNTDNVENVLDEVRPYLIADGGNVTLVDIDIETRIIKLALEGACSSCPSSTTTMKMGIEKTLKENFRDLGGVVAVDSSSLLSPTLHLLQTVNDALQKIIPAVSSMEGQVSIEDVDAETGNVIVQFQGPPRLKKGIELVLKDNSVVNTVTFKEISV